jgi:hypothetical protein
MKATLLFLTMLTALVSLSQTDKKYLYLENNETGKIKKINLKSTWLLNYHIDTLEEIIPLIQAIFLVMFQQ